MLTYDLPFPLWESVRRGLLHPPPRRHVRLLASLAQHVINFAEKVLVGIIRRDTLFRRDERLEVLTSPGFEGSAENVFAHVQAARIYPQVLDGPALLKSYRSFENRKKLGTVH